VFLNMVRRKRWWQCSARCAQPSPMVYQTDTAAALMAASAHASELSYDDYRSGKKFIKNAGKFLDLSN